MTTPRNPDRTHGQEFGMTRMIDNGGTMDERGCVTRQQVDGAMLGMVAEDPGAFPSLHDC